MKRSLLSLLVIITMCFTVCAKDVLKGTLLDRFGEPIRAAPRNFSQTYPDPLARIQTMNEWYVLKDHHYNTVRLTFGYSYRGTDYNNPVWSWEETFAELDKIVQCAEDVGMTLIINYHVVGEQDEGKGPAPDYTLERCNIFWEKMAPRYKDKECVMYELQNEPSFSTNAYNQDYYKKPFLEMYNKVREWAPFTQLIVFSKPQHSNIDKLIEWYEDDLDWDFCTAGYHLYGGGTSDPVVRAQKMHRTVCTEWDYPAAKQSYAGVVDGKPAYQCLEEIGDGWMDWSTHEAPIYTLAYMIPDALKNGFAWWKESSMTFHWITPKVETNLFEGETLAVSVSIKNGVADSCKLYLDGHLISKKTQAPYEWNTGVLTDLKAGTYSLRLQAWDKIGATKTSTKIFSILPGKTDQIEILNPTDDAWVQNEGPHSGKGEYIRIDNSQTTANLTKGYLKFDLETINASKIGAAKLRLYNRKNSATGYLYLHEILNDQWNEADIAWSNAPKNTAIPGQKRDDRGGEQSATVLRIEEEEWCEYDVTEFINQELGGDRMVTFAVTNFHESQDRFFNSNRTNQTFYFDSKEGTNSPQLILSEVGTYDKEAVTGIELPKDKTLLLPEQKVEIIESVLPSNARNKKVSWFSSDESIATVSADGVVLGITPGITQIEATTEEGTFTSTCTVEVKSIEADLEIEPVAYWDFNIGTGSQIKDQISNKTSSWQNGTSGLGWTNGVEGKAASLGGGDNDKFKINYDPLTNCSEYTISMWVYLRKLPFYQGLLTNRGTGENSSSVWGLASHYQGVDSRSKGKGIKFEHGIISSKWHNLVMTWGTDGVQKVYLDGELQNEANLGVTSYIASNNWWIGDDICCSDREMVGNVDELSMFNKRLSEEDIALLYNNGAMSRPLLEIIPGVTGIVKKNKREIEYNIFPNPAAQEVEVTFQSLEKGKTELSVYSISGQLIEIINLGESNMGSNTRTVNIENLCNGVYVFAIKTNNEIGTKKVIVRK